MTIDEKTVIQFCSADLMSSHFYKNKLLFEVIFFYDERKPEDMQMYEHDGTTG